MNQLQYRQSHHLVRSLHRAVTLECLTAARGVLSVLTKQWQALRDAGINPFDLMGDRPGATWIVGQTPRDNDNWRQELKRRQFDRVIRRGAYQPGPKPGQLPA